MTTIDSASSHRFADDTTFRSETPRREDAMSVPGDLPEAEGVQGLLCGMFAAPISSRLQSAERPEATIETAGGPRFADDTTFRSETARRQKGEYPGRPCANQELAIDRALAVVPEADGVRGVLCGMFAARICSRLPEMERPDPLLVFCAGQLLNCDPSALREPVLAGFAPIVASVREKRYNALALSASTIAVQTVAVADAFVAMITGRSGRAFSPKLAIEELRASGTFSKRLLAALQLSLKRSGGPLCANASRERDVALAA